MGEGSVLKRLHLSSMVCALSGSSPAVSRASFIETVSSRPRYLHTTAADYCWNDGTRKYSTPLESVRMRTRIRGRGYEITEVVTRDSHPGGSALRFVTCPGPVLFSEHRQQWVDNNRLMMLMARSE